MRNVALYRFAGCILLAGCIPSAYREGMTVIGLPEPLPSDEVPRGSTAAHHDTEERIQFNNWMEECEGKLGEVSSHVAVTMRLPSFDLEQGWSARTPTIAITPHQDATAPVFQFLDALAHGSGERVIGVTAVLGRFALEQGNTATLSRLTDFTREWNTGMKEEDRMWFSRARAGVWRSGIMALSLHRVDDEPHARYSPFRRWLREVEEKEVVPWPLLNKLRLDTLLSDEIVLGTGLIGAEGRVTFDAIAVTLVREGTSIGCLPVTTY